MLYPSARQLFLAGLAFSQMHHVWVFKKGNKVFFSRVSSAQLLRVDAHTRTHACEFVCARGSPSVDLQLFMVDAYLRSKHLAH